jgi:hypothetical protein
LAPRGDASLEIGAYERAAGKTGATMTAHTKRVGDYQTARDILLASSFGLWAVLLGFMPVMVIYSLSS